MWNWIIIHLSSISLFGTLLVNIGTGDTVEFHRGEIAPPLEISPSSPTTVDVISFTTPLNSVVYSNSCFAGSVAISRDELNSLIHIGHQRIPPNIVCITLFDPVVGAEGSFGPLDIGNWVLRDSHNNELRFHVSGIIREPNDCSGDGILDVEDFGCVSTTQERDAVLAALNTFPGDFDGTDGVAFADFLTLAGNFGKVGLPYSEGNIDLVDDVSFRDFQTLADNFGKGGGASAAAIPEPSSLTLICLAGFLTEFVRKRRLASCW